jgi:type IV pilus assembly protein PilP
VLIKKIIKNRDAAEKESRPKAGFLSLGTYAVCVLCLCLFLLSGSSCSKTEDPGKKPAQKTSVKKQKTKKIAKKTAKEQPSEKLEKDPPYSYDATGKPDPFLPLISDGPIKRSVPKSDGKPLTPLQKYDLKELNLVAIIAKEKGASALLEDPKGFGYIVNEGIQIGKNNGVIKKVTKNGIIIEERVYNSDGDLEPKISTLTIQHME